MNGKKRHEYLRKKLWLTAWAGTSSALNCTSPAIATRYADQALADFDDRFTQKQ